MSRVRYWFRRLVRWLYGAYLTRRYIDTHDVFPAVVFPGRMLRVKISKAADARLVVRGRLIVEPWLSGTQPVVLALQPGAVIEFSGDTTVGDDVRLSAADGARLTIGGRRAESGAGFTARAVVLANEKVTIGADCIVGWDTVITDCDWHQLGDGDATATTTIGDHVWVAQGVKVLKGAAIGDDCVIAAGAVVAGCPTFADRSLIGGVPARRLGTAPPWQRDMAQRVAQRVRA